MSRVELSKPSVDILMALVQQAKEGETVSTWLQSHGYSSVLSHVAFDSSVAHLDFSGCQFEHVSFSGALNGSKFHDCTFINVQFNQVDLNRVVFSHSHFEQTAFHHVDLNQASFTDVTLSHSVLDGCDFSNASFDHSDFSSSLFVSPNLFNVLDYENTFAHTHLIQMQAAQPQPNDYAMTEAMFHPVTANIGTLDDGEWAESAFADLAQYGLGLNTIDETLFFDLIKPANLPQGVSIQGFVEDIKHAISTATANPVEGLSIVQQVLQFTSPNIDYIKAIAKEVVDQSDSVFIPGGEDVIEAFYGKNNYQGQQFSWLNKYNDDLKLDGIDNFEDIFYLKQYLEFAMVDEAFAADKPVMGVCHGLQLLNVYFGGTIKNVEGHNGISPELDIHTHQGVLGSLVEEGMQGLSYHNQAIDKLGFGLEVVASYEGVIKGVQAVDAKKLIMTQFHPEYNVDLVSTKIMHTFVDMAVEHALQNKALELKDILNIEDNSLDNLLSVSVEPEYVTASYDGSSMCEANISAFDPNMVLNQSLIEDYSPVFAA